MGFFSNLFPSIGRAFSSAWEGVKSVGKSAWEGIKTAGSAALNVVKALPSIAVGLGKAALGIQDQQEQPQMQPEIPQIGSAAYTPMYTPDRYMMNRDQTFIPEDQGRNMYGPSGRAQNEYEPPSGRGNMMRDLRTDRGGYGASEDFPSERPRMRIQPWTEDQDRAFQESRTKPGYLRTPGQEYTGMPRQPPPLMRKTAMRRSQPIQRQPFAYQPQQAIRSFTPGDAPSDATKRFRASGTRKMNAPSNMDRTRRSML